MYNLFIVNNYNYKCYLSMSSNAAHQIFVKKCFFFLHELLGSSVCLFYIETKTHVKHLLSHTHLIQLNYIVHLICTNKEILDWVFPGTAVQVLVPILAGLQTSQHDSYQLGIPLYLCFQLLLSARQELQDLDC